MGHRDPSRARTALPALVCAIAAGCLLAALPRAGLARDSANEPVDSGWSRIDAEGTDAVADMAAVTGAPPEAASTGAAQDLVGIGRAWRADESLDTRVGRSRRAAVEHGVWNLDSAARALIAGSGTPTVEDARAAIRLAPDLPLAHMALARAMWLQESSPIAAARAVWAAIAAVPRHLEAAVWFGGSALYVLALGLISGGLLFTVLAACAVAAHAAHDLGDFVSGEMPVFSRVALLAALAGLPLALGQGWVGLGLGLFAVAALYGCGRQRLALVAAVAALIAGLYPLARLSGSALTAYAADPVLEAAYSATDGFATPIDRRRLEAAGESDPLAAQALAMTARRSGHLANADARYQTIVADGGDAAMLNNAANVRLALGHMESALELYAEASELGASSKVLFNLSQAYGAAFQVEDLNRTLADAQSVDGDTVAELTQLQGSEQKGFTVDLPLARSTLWERALDTGAAERFAQQLRARIAPGAVGVDWQWTAGAFATAFAFALLAGRRFRASHRCSRCGRRLCPRCDPEFGGGEICEGCSRLFHQPETTDRSLRLARINALRARDARLNRIVLFTSLLVPGSAGLFSRRPWASLVGALAAGIAAWSLVYRNGVAPDPLVAGAAAPVAFCGVAVVCLCLHALTVTTSLAARRKS